MLVWCAMPAPSQRMNLRGRGLRSFVVVAICLGALACRSSREAVSQPPKEVATLGQLIGKWKSTTHRYARDLSGVAGDIVQTFECKWTLDKNYVACAQMGETGGEKVKEVDVFGYSGQAGLYTMMVVVDIGDRPPQVFANWFHVDKNTWHFLPREGTRTTWEFKSPDYQATTTERSADGGAWIVSYTGEHTRIE